MKGLIAFIDILGYQSFLENNSATDSARSVLKLVTDLPRTVDARNRQKWQGFWKDKQDAQFYSDIKVEHLIFSDTIVLLHSYAPEEAETDPYKFIYFSLLSTELMAELFIAGLPSRGVIHEGEFINEGTCFAGRGIVEAYRACAELDFSGLVLSDKLTEWIPRQTEFNPDVAFIDYLAPLRNGKEKRMRCLNWYRRFDSAKRAECDTDIIQFVSESFWQHRKDLPLAADSKIRNTCKLMRKLRMVTKEVENQQKKKIEEKK